MLLATKSFSSQLVTSKKISCRALRLLWTMYGKFSHSGDYSCWFSVFSPERQKFPRLGENLPIWCTWPGCCKLSTNPNQLVSQSGDIPSFKGNTPDQRTVPSCLNNSQSYVISPFTFWSAHARVEHPLAHDGDKMLPPPPPLPTIISCRKRIFTRSCFSNQT